MKTKRRGLGARRARRGGAGDTGGGDTDDTIERVLRLKNLLQDLIDKEQDQQRKTYLLDLRKNLTQAEAANQRSMRTDRFLGRIGAIFKGVGSTAKSLGNGATNVASGAKNVASGTGSVLGGILGPLWQTISKYIGMLIGILIIVVVLTLVFSGALTRGGSSGSSGRSGRSGTAGVGGNVPNAGGVFGRFWAWVRGLLDRMIGWVLPGARFSQLMQKVSMRKYTYRTEVPRRFIGAGRCDHASWFELPDASDPVNKPGFCERTTNPAPVRWVLDTDRMPELDKMPEAVRKVVTNDEQKMRVSIPWEKQASFFVPMCNRAAFADGSSAAYLFTDNGLSCSLRSQPSTPYSAKERPKKPTPGAGVGTFATEANPMC